MALPPVIPERIRHSEDLIIRSLLNLGMEGIKRLPFSRRPYTTLMDDTAIIIGDMVADAEAKWDAGFIARSRAGQLPSAGPLAQQTPLVAPERTSGRLLDTAS
ncbi:hypothetical protein N1030_02615 [Desulfovibrio mangrovi]|uniref:hypothetical protein n=1 Tax=Desulfovibrio mangrovi TaxID=2976983 RepID=UPI002245EDB8|nr:hypothetical protein [Desulfovibrio mangrovi]UZP67887.1 hypothetical protein N1030_02615 [Desulfovibrio mangrovi]